VEIATYSSLIEVKKKVLDALAAYGEPSISDILKVVENSSTEAVRTHGLAKVEELKKKSKGQ